MKTMNSGVCTQNHRLANAEPIVSQPKICTKKQTNLTELAHGIQPWNRPQYICSLADSRAYSLARSRCHLLKHTCAYDRHKISVRAMRCTNTVVLRDVCIFRQSFLFHCFFYRCINHEMCVSRSYCCAARQRRSLYWPLRFSIAAHKTPSGYAALRLYSLFFFYF